MCYGLKVLFFNVSIIYLMVRIAEWIVTWTHPSRQGLLLSEMNFMYNKVQNYKFLFLIIQFQISSMINLILTWALHIGQVLSLSNQVATHSSQNICLQCSIVASCKLSWQIGQIPPHVFKSSVVGFIPYCWKLICTLKTYEIIKSYFI